MELKECLTGLTWYPVNQRASAAKIAQKRMAEKHLLEAVWVLCESKGDKKQRKTAFAIANGQANGKVAAAAAFARAATNGIMVERMESGFYWVAVTVQGVPMPGFDREYTLDDAKSTAQALIDQLQFGPGAIHVPDGFAMHHEGCKTFAQITESLPTIDVAFRRIDRGFSGLAIVAAAVGVTLISAVGGYFWWQVHLKHEEDLKMEAGLRARMASLINQRNLRSAHDQALQKALKADKAAMSELENEWGNGMPIVAGEYVDALVGRITPSWGWAPVSFSVTGNRLDSTWVSDIPGHPDYIDFAKLAKENGWHVIPNTYYIQSDLSRPIPDAPSKLVVNPGFRGIGLLLDSLPATWKVGNTKSYPPLPYLQKQFVVMGSSLAAMAQTLHVLKQVPGVRIRGITVAHGDWSMKIGLFEKASDAQTVGHGENAP